MKVEREDISKVPLTHLACDAAPTRLTWCGLWVWHHGEPRAQLPHHDAMPDAERMVTLVAVKRTDVVCDRCAELNLRAIAASIERLRTLRREGRTR